MSELKPCPFCGHEIIEDWGDSTWSGFNKWRYCPECQAQGPHMHSRRGEGSDECQARADEAWNTRVDFAAERDAALAGAVRVRPLVFQFEPYDKEPSDKARSDGTYVVRTEHEFYRVIPVEGGRFMAPSVSLGTFPTLEDAFETVQKHHDARIRAAIEPAESSISAAETVLAALDPEALRPILSRLANDTPATCYYSKDFGESMRALPEKADRGEA